MFANISRAGYLIFGKLIYNPAISDSISFTKKFLCVNLLLFLQQAKSIRIKAGSVFLFLKFIFGNILMILFPIFSHSLSIF